MRHRVIEVERFSKRVYVQRYTTPDLFIDPTLDAIVQNILFKRNAGTGSVTTLFVISEFVSIRLTGEFPENMGVMYDTACVPNLAIVNHSGNRYTEKGASLFIEALRLSRCDMLVLKHNRIDPDAHERLHQLWSAAGKPDAHDHLLVGLHL